MLYILTRKARQPIHLLEFHVRERIITNILVFITASKNSNHRRSTTNSTYVRWEMINLPQCPSQIRGSIIIWGGFAKWNALLNTLWLYWSQHMFQLQVFFTWRRLAVETYVELTAHVSILPWKHYNGIISCTCNAFQPFFDVNFLKNKGLNLKMALLPTGHNFYLSSHIKINIQLQKL